MWKGVVRAGPPWMRQGLAQVVVAVVVAVSVGVLVLMMLVVMEGVFLLAVGIVVPAAGVVVKIISSAAEKAKEEGTTKTLAAEI